MEPFELVITLVISELACIPMSDRSIPITYGIVAILTMFVIHQAILLMSKNNKMQQLINGKPIMVVTSKGIDMHALRSLNMGINDLLQAMRSAKYFSFEEISYGIMETNGQLTVVENKSLSEKQQTLPIALITEGKWVEDSVVNHGFDKNKILKLLGKRKIKLRNVVFFAVDENNRISLQTKYAPMVFEDAGELQ